jgi:hypothetical protein
VTSLDKIISILSSKCELISAIQFTPQNIQIVVIIDEFWKCLQAFKYENIRFRFIEKRKAGLDIHLSFFSLKTPYDISFRVIDYSSDFIQALKDKFPPAAIFVSELNSDSS